jgi:hypothetical protein
MISMTDRQLDQIYKDVASQSTKVCVLIAQDGMPFPQQSINRAKLILRPQIMEKLPGSHHFHSDPDSVDGVVGAIIKFLEEASSFKLQSKV